MDRKKGPSRKAPGIRKTPTIKPLPAQPDASPEQEEANLQELRHDQADRSLPETFQKNLTALVQATEMLTQGAEAVFQHQRELLRRTVAQATTPTTTLLAELPLLECSSAVDRFRQALETGRANSQEMIELAEQSRRDAFEAMQQQMVQRFQERTKRLQEFVNTERSAGQKPSPKPPRPAK